MMDIPAKTSYSLHMFTHELGFIFQGDIRSVLDHFSRLMAVHFSFLAPDGRELQVGEGKPHCEFCQLVRNELDEAEKCHKCDANGWELAAKSGQAVWYRCHAGMIDGCMAVRTGDRIIGYMMIGQFRNDKQCNPELRVRMKKKYGNDKLQASYLETPYYSEEQIADIMGVFSVLVNFIVSQRLIAVRGPDPIQPLLAYMSEHPQQTLSTAEAARLLNRSTSSLSHIFKQTINKSFLQYQIDVKLDQADNLFKTRNDITVREVAYELGFKDPYYFSRLYKKHRGYPPSELLKSGN